MNSNRSSKSKEMKLVMMNSLTNSDRSSPDHRQNTSLLSGKLLPSATELDVDFDISNTAVSINLLQHPAAKSKPQGKAELPGFDQEKWEKLGKMQEEVNKRMAMYEFDEEVASRSKSFTVDMTDEPTSQLHQEKQEPSP